MPTLPQNEGGDFKPPPGGTHPARCYRIVDLGTQQGEYMGVAKHQRKIVVSWELDIKMEDGRNFSVHKRYTWSMFERSRLRQDLESWRGRAFQESDLGPGGFDVSKLLNVPCLLTIVHDTRDGRTYANVGAVSGMPKGMEAAPLTNPTALLWLEDGEFDQAVFDELSDGLKATIMKSPEWAELQVPASGISGTDGMAPQESDGSLDEELSDSIPF